MVLPSSNDSKCIPQRHRHIQFPKEVTTVGTPCSICTYMALCSISNPIMLFDEEASDLWVDFVPSEVGQSTTKGEKGQSVTGMLPL